MKKFVFIINFPRGGGKSLSSLKEIHQNEAFYIWPYEFFYFSLFKKIGNDKEKIIGAKLNNFFLREIKEKLNKFEEKINFKKLANIIEKKKNFYFNNIQYLKFLIDSLNQCYIKKLNFNGDIHIINTTARGFDWSLINYQNFYYFITDRNYQDCFLSVRKNSIGSSGFYNFYHIHGKKSLYYWVETFRQINDNLKNVDKSKLLTLQFENKKFNENTKKFINKKNVNKIFKFLNVKSSVRNKNFYFGVHKGKKPKNISLSKIEGYLIEKYIKNQKISLYQFCKNILISLKFFNNNLNEFNNFKKLKCILKILFSFFLFYFLKYQKKNLAKILKKGNKHIQYMSLWV